MNLNSNQLNNERWDWKRNQLKKKIKNNSSEPGLNHQTYDPSHEMKIMS
jgi:hypothetical protein